MSFRWYLPNSTSDDDNLRLLAGYREVSGRGAEYAARRFLEWLDGEPATVPRTMDFLWAYLPLQFRSEADPVDRYRQELADFIPFAGPKLGWDTEGCGRVSRDEVTYAQRWMERGTTPLPVWLEELRQELAERRMPCSIPAADPDDPLLLQALRDLKAGPAGWVSGPIPRPTSALAVVASSCEALQMVGTFLSVLGAGVKLTATGAVPRAPGRTFLEAMGWEAMMDPLVGDRVFKTVSTTELAPVTLSAAWARAAGFLRVAQGRLVPTARGRKLGYQPQDDWWLLFRAAALKLHWARREGRYRPFWVDVVDDHLPSYLRMAHYAGERGMATLPVAALTWSRVAQVWETDDLNRDQVRWQTDSVSWSIRHDIFGPLELLGAAETWVGGADGAVRLTPLGHWAVGRMCREMGQIQSSRRGARPAFPTTGPAAGTAAGTAVAGTAAVNGDQGNVIDLAARRGAAARRRQPR